MEGPRVAADATELATEAAADSVPKTPPPADPQIARLASLVEARRAEADARQPPLPAAIAADLAQAAEARDEAARPTDRERVCERIRQVVRDKAMHPSIVGRAADLVIHHGVPFEELRAILADVEAMRAAGSLRSAGRFFHAKIKALAARFGAPWSTANPNPQRAPNGEEPQRE
jgi:hypothetical protein